MPILTCNMETTPTPFSTDSVGTEDSTYTSLQTSYSLITWVSTDPEAESLSMSGPISGGEYLMSITWTGLSTCLERTLSKQQGVPPTSLAPVWSVSVREAAVCRGDVVEMQRQECRKPSVHLSQTNPRLRGAPSCSCKVSILWLNSAQKKPTM